VKFAKNSLIKIFLCVTLGSEPGLLDYAIWPWFERIPVLKLLYPKLYDVEATKLQNPTLVRNSKF